MRIPILAATTLLALSLSPAAHGYDPRTTITDFDSRLARIGAPKIEGTDKIADKPVPMLYFGDRKINRHYDVVDAIRRSRDATATIFVRDGIEFVRVSTNVLTPEGKRGIGTLLAHNKAYEALAGGFQYCGTIDVLGNTFDACYNPLKDAAGKVVGAIYVGHRK